MPDAADTFEDLRDHIKGHMRALNDIAGISGFEQGVVSYLRPLFMEVADEVEVDTFGNLYATRRGARPGPTLLLSAHSDEIGCVVKSVRDDGFLRFERVGFPVPSLLVGRKVLVNGRFGVIGCKLVHMQTEEDRSRVTPIEDLYIDVGAESAAEVAELGIEIGDQVTYLSELGEYHNPNPTASQVRRSTTASVALSWSKRCADCPRARWPGQSRCSSPPRRRLVCAALP